MSTDFDRFLAQLARATTDKVAKEHPQRPIMTATALSIDTTIDAYPHVRCHIDGNPAGQVDVVPIATGAAWPPGQRIIVVYTEPAGAWALGPTLGSQVAYYCDNACGTDTPAACVTFSLDHQQTVLVTYAIDGDFGSWTVDDEAVEAPVGTVVTATVRLEAGEHTICVTTASSKSEQCVTLTVATGGNNVDQAGCVSFGEPAGNDYTVASPSPSTRVAVTNAAGPSDVFTIPAGGGGTIDSVFYDNSGPNTGGVIEFSINGAYTEDSGPLAGTVFHPTSYTVADGDTVQFIVPGGQDAFGEMDINCQFHVTGVAVDPGDQSLPWTP